jgi:hypothetical protein
MVRPAKAAQRRQRNERRTPATTRKASPRVITDNDPEIDPFISRIRRSINRELSSISACWPRRPTPRILLGG